MKHPGHAFAILNWEKLTWTWPRKFNAYFHLLKLKYIGLLLLVITIWDDKCTEALKRVLWWVNNEQCRFWCQIEKAWQTFSNSACSRVLDKSRGTNLSPYPLIIHLIYSFYCFRLIISSTSYNRILNNIFFIIFFRSAWVDTERKEI